MELMLTIRPFEAITSGANAFVTRNTPYTFTCIWKSKSASLVLSMGSITATPALLTMPYSGWSELRTTSTAAATSAGTVTSRRTALTFGMASSAFRSCSLRAPANT